MAQSHSGDGVELPEIEHSGPENSLLLQSHHQGPRIPENLSSSSGKDSNLDEESAVEWATIERLPTFERLRLSLLDENNGKEDNIAKRKRIIDVTKLSVPEKHELIEKLIGDIEHDNHHLLQKIRERMDK